MPESDAKVNGQHTDSLDAAKQRINAELHEYHEGARRGLLAELRLTGSPVVEEIDSPDPAGILLDLLTPLVRAGLVTLNVVFTVALSRPNYDQYIVSPKWREKAEAAKERAGQQCQVCNVSRDQSILDAHHRTYERLGHEEPGDLIVLCRDCHQLFHENGRLAR